MAQKAVIITALQCEQLAVSEHLRNVREETHGRGSVYRIGTFDEDSAPWEVLVAEIGAGNEGAAAEVERAITHFEPAVAIFVGIAGGVKDVEQGSVVASTKICQYESGKDRDDGFEPRPEVHYSDYTLVSRARHEASEGRWRKRIKAGSGTALDNSTSSPPNVILGPIAAGPKVLNSTRSPLFNFLKKYYGDSVAVEMEGYGFLRGVWMNAGVKGIVIRGVSDMLADKAAKADANWQPTASRNAAAFAFQILSRLNLERSDNTQPSEQVKPVDAPVAKDIVKTFDNLRRNFESLALRSNGLWHVMSERQAGPEIPDCPDSGMPPGLVPAGQAGGFNQVFAFQNPPGDPPQPRKLTDEEAKCISKEDVSQRYIRDSTGRVHAVWVPSIIRSGYFYGDHDVYKVFLNIADAAANAMLSLSDALVLRLPENIRSLCRPHNSTNRRYFFGSVPSQPKQWMGQGWSAAVAVFDEGVIVDNPESSTGGDRLAATWMLLVHRIGWSAKPGASLSASRWHWLHNTSTAYILNGVLPSNLQAEEIPTFRFYSVLGRGMESATDICWASVWAIDLLLELLAITESDYQGH